MAEHKVREDHTTTARSLESVVGLPESASRFAGVDCSLVLTWRIYRIFDPGVQHLSPRRGLLSQTKDKQLAIDLDVKELLHDDPGCNTCLISS